MGVPRGFGQPRVPRSRCMTWPSVAAEHPWTSWTRPSGVPGRQPDQRHRPVRSATPARAGRRTLTQPPARSGLLRPDLTGRGQRAHHGGPGRVDRMWARVPEPTPPVGSTARPQPGPSSPQFSPEAGIGQYGMTVLDHANGTSRVRRRRQAGRRPLRPSVSKNGTGLRRTPRPHRPEPGPDQRPRRHLNGPASAVTTGTAPPGLAPGSRQDHAELAHLDGRLRPRRVGRGLSRARTAVAGDGVGDHQCSVRLPSAIWRQST
jgi:hypothetical protein